MDNKDTPLPVEQNVSNTDINDNNTASAAAVTAKGGTHERVEPGSGATDKAQELCQSYLPQGKPTAGIPWSDEDLEDGPGATLEAPYITGADADHLTQPELIVGVYLNIPRSPKIWTGDQLKITWGYNTFYSTIAEATTRKGPRLVQYLNSQELAHYDDGEVFVYYEVVRGNRLIGISEKLKVTLLGIRKSRTRSTLRRHAIRHRKLPF
jgi:hypothetical protein